MRRAISLILVALTIMSIIFIPAQASSGEEYITIRSAGKEYKYTEDVMGFKFYITNPNDSSKKLRINEEILSTDGYLVYGSHKDVPQDPINDYKEGQWRYVGYSYEGLKFSNFHFPWEGRVEGRLDKDRKWIKEPWKVIGNTGKELESDQSDYNKNNPELVAGWIEETMCNEGKGNPIIQWMMFINDESKEVLEMLSEDIPGMKKTTSLSEAMIESEKEKMIYEAREAHLHDIATFLEEAEERGFKKGIEMGIEEVIKKDKAEILRRLYTKKVGELPIKLQKIIRNASSTTLELLTEKVFDIETIEELSELIEKE